jgi:hypothetical protein
MTSTGFQDIRFKFENFAGIDTCSFSLSPLTVITGPNSAGKTYIVYAIYSFLRELDQLLQVPLSPVNVNRLIAEGSITVDLSNLHQTAVNSLRIGMHFSRSLPRWFSVPEEFFQDAKATIVFPDIDLLSMEFSLQAQVRRDVFVDFSKMSGKSECVISLSKVEDRVPPSVVLRLLKSTLTELMFSRFFTRPFAITSERTGISLFWKELDINKNQLIDKLIESKGKKLDPWDLLDGQTSRYAIPITDNIDVARDAENVAKGKSFLAEELELLKFVREPFDKISMGKYRYSKDGISYEYGRGRSKVILPIYVTSSSTKSLFLLDLFINHIARKGDLLVFDEPELNLHPANQRLMAQVIARLVAVGVNVLVTTHSDFLIRELNNRIMLDGMQKETEVLDSLKIDPREILPKRNVSGLLLNSSRRLESVAVGEFGLDMKSIDEAIVGAAGLQGRIVDYISRTKEDT